MACRSCGVTLKERNSCKRCGAAFCTRCVQPNVQLVGCRCCGGGQQPQQVQQVQPQGQTRTTVVQAGGSRFGPSWLFGPRTQVITTQPGVVMQSQQPNVVVASQPNVVVASQPNVVVSSQPTTQVIETGRMFGRFGPRVTTNTTYVTQQPQPQVGYAQPQGMYVPPQQQHQPPPQHQPYQQQQQQQQQPAASHMTIDQPPPYQTNYVQPSQAYNALGRGPAPLSSPQQTQSSPQQHQQQQPMMYPPVNPAHQK